MTEAPGSRPAAASDAAASRAAPPRDGPVGGAPALVFWLAAVLVVGLDLVTKAVVNTNLEPGGPGIQVLGDGLRFRHIRNSGGLFGLLPGNATYFAVVSTIAVVAILILAFRSRRRRSDALALGLVLGGALGNLHDRVRLGEVVDFIDVGVGIHRWPTFNVADAGVTGGVILLLLSVNRRPAALDGDASAQGDTDDPG